LNTAGVAAETLLNIAGIRQGVSLDVRKALPLASGLGGSAASAVASVVAVNELLHVNASPEMLIRCALAGERVASGAAHPDNVAPALVGGFVLARSADPPDVIRLPIPAGLACAVVRPHIEIHTGEARALLGDSIRLSDAVKQWANVAGLIAGLYRSDHELIARSLEDYVAEPIRSLKVPGFSAMKRAALEAGALGCSLSGSGPAVFALCRTEADAARAGAAMIAALRGSIGADLYVSPISPHGARVIAESDV
jgi:homoserine kinase